MSIFESANSGELKDKEIVDKQISRMRLSDVRAVGEWLSTLRDAVKHERERNEPGYDARDEQLRDTIKKMLDHFDFMDVFVEGDFDAWATEAEGYLDNPDKLISADLVTLRKLLSYHRHNSDFTRSVDEYWLRLAMNGHLLRILSSFENIYRRACEETLL